VTTTPEGADEKQTDTATEPTPRKAEKNVHHKHNVHEVVFVTYPKLLFIWPLILAGLVFAPFSSPDFKTPPAQDTPATAQADQQPADELAQPAAEGETETTPVATASRRLEVLGWIYLLVLFVVLLTLGVDVDRNQFVFWLVLVAALWIGGRWLADVKGFTLFGDIYKWFDWLDVQYNRSLGLALSLILLVPYLIMIGWAHINDKWRITHNEFEHYAFGKMDDSLGRGAKTIRTNFPDVLELLLGLAGTLIVYNATGTKVLRRIPHVMFLPMVRKRLNLILERTAITTAQMEEEEDDDEDL